MKGRMTRQHKSQREREEKYLKFQNTFQCVECNICELAIYRRNSQLIYEKLWEQVRSSTKISQIQYNIYIILSTKNIF